MEKKKFIQDAGLIVGVLFLGILIIIGSSYIPKLGKTGQAFIFPVDSNVTIYNLLKGISTDSGGYRFVIPDNSSPRLISALSSLSSELNFVGSATIIESELVLLHPNQKNYLIHFTKNGDQYGLTEPSIKIMSTNSSIKLIIGLPNGAPFDENSFVDSIYLLTNYENYSFLLDTSCIRPDGSSCETVGINQTICIDSDGGLDYNVKGTASGFWYGYPDQFETHTDLCDLGKLYEYYCNGSSLEVQTEIICPNGCSNGSCIQNQTFLNCTNECLFVGSTMCNGDYIQTCGNYDADLCLEWNSGTYCTYGCAGGLCLSQINVTNCTDSCNYVGQTQCNGDYIQTCGNYDADLCLEWNSGTYCDYGCAGGLCLSQINVTNCTDSCNYVGQTQCNGDYIQTCGNYDADLCLEWNSGTYCDYGCYSGYCKVSNVTITDTITNIRSIPQSYKQVIGSTAVEDNIAAIDLAGFLGIQDTIEDSQAIIDDYTIVIGGPCINEISANLLGLPYPTCGIVSTIPENRGIIQIFNNGGKKQILIAGWEALETRIAAQAVVRYLEFYDDMNSDTVIVYGNNVDDVNIG
jgi:hypothetical protein